MRKPQPRVDLLGPPHPTQLRIASIRTCRSAEHDVLTWCETILIREIRDDLGHTQKWSIESAPIEITFVWSIHKVIPPPLLNGLTWNKHPYFDTEQESAPATTRPGNPCLYVSHVGAPTDRFDAFQSLLSCCLSKKPELFGPLFSARFIHVQGQSVLSVDQP